MFHSSACRAITSILGCDPPTTIGRMRALDGFGLTQRILGVKNRPVWLTDSSVYGRRILDIATRFQGPQTGCRSRGSASCQPPMPKSSRPP